MKAWSTKATLFSLSLLAVALLIVPNPTAGGTAKEKTVTLELKEVTVSEALTRLFREAGENFVLEPGVRTDQKISLSLKNMPFEKALSRVCEAAGLYWEKRDSVYIVRRSDFFFYRFWWDPLAPRPSVPRLRDEKLRDLRERLRILADWRRWQWRLELPDRLLWQFGLPLFCFQCGEWIPTIRTCPQCQRTMEPDWDYCPYDRSALPALPKKCPKCGSDLRTFPPRPARSLTHPEFRVRVETARDHVRIIATARKKVTLKVYDPQNRLLAEKEIRPGAPFSGTLKDLLKKEPEKGVYRIDVVGDDGKVKGSVQVEVKDSSPKTDSDKKTTAI
ncbi:MAG: secretin and TonB N-terminal domain-containing protein [Armatimonadetes bacterium]|nr:secretin and TonB N-terminal domain-containing protein [Armatimonadota bacterium]MDW8122658.1 secretin and TonB N-terminal domain-containing protein [Armatimonadota bacterium]